MAKGPSADSILAETSRLEEERYQEDYRPVNRKLITSTNDTSLIKAARTELDKRGGGMDQARLMREAGRYGKQISSGDMSEIKRLGSQQTALNETLTMGRARTEQQDRNESVRAEMINLGRGIASSGSSSLQQAASLESSRKNAADQQKAQQKAGYISAGVGLAATAALMFL